jgi:hypothetical protein
LERINFESPSNIEELDDIEPSLTTLKFGNVGLRSPKPFRESSLAEATGLPRFDQKLPKPGICRREDGLRQSWAFAVMPKTV